MQRIFITGTDTEIGKTVVSCALMRQAAAAGLRVAGFKPVASGCEQREGALRNEDALALMRAASHELPYDTVNPYAFEPAIAPHIAALEAGVAIDPEMVARRLDQVAKQKPSPDLAIIEGVGGWCVPMGDGLMLADLARVLTRQVILVVGLRLGCINHALASARLIRDDGFHLLGWVANDLSGEMARRDENLATLREQINAPFLGLAPHGQNEISTDTRWLTADWWSGADERWD